jgi:helicase
MVENLGVTEFYPPQSEAIRKGIMEGKNLLMVTHTASGKTFLAILVALNKVLTVGGKTVYLTPLKALAREIFEGLRRYEGLGVTTAITVGNYDSADPYLQHYDIIVTTYEKMDSLLRHNPAWIRDVNLLIIDEIHYIDDEKRGPVLESLIAKLKMSEKRQVLALSATIGNPKEIASWIGAEAVISDWRPVPLKEGVYYRGLITYKDGTTRRVPVFYGTPVYDLVMDSVREGGQALVFVNSRKRAVSLAESSSRTLGLPSDKNAEETAKELLESSEVPGLNKKLANLVRKGVCFHHAGLNYIQRKLIEEAFRQGIIKIVYATPTLAAGVNLPARRVIIEDYVRYNALEGRTYIKVLEYKQFAGRAGRPGYDEYGDAILISKNLRDLDFLYTYYINGSPENVVSKIGEVKALRRHVLAYISTMKKATTKDVEKYLRNTLYHIQRGWRSLENPLRRSMEFLIDNGFLKKEGSIIKPTLIGEKVSEVYIDPLTALYLLKGMEEGVKPTVFSVLHLIAASPDMPKLTIRKREVIFLEEVYDERFPEILLGMGKRSNIDYDDMLRELKTALFLEDWINEVPEQNISEKYDLGPGDIRAYIETADWIAYSFHKISQSLETLSIQQELLKEVWQRVKYGVRPELIQLTQIPGVGRVRARRLYTAGYKTIEDLAGARLEHLIRIEGIGEEVARNIIEYARMKTAG